MPAGDTHAERLARELFGGADENGIANEVAAWLANSRRFRAFADAHRDKIRKKLRSAADAEARRDVRAELRVAHLLLADRRIELAFEAYGSGKGGPDFTVAFRGERSFNLEVTRLRGSPAAGFRGTLLTKLRQLPSSAPNAVLAAIDGDGADTLDVAEAIRALRARADASDNAFFATRGLAGTRVFHRQYRRLGAIVLWREAAHGDARTTLWINPAARIALPNRAVRACVHCLQAG